MLCRLPSEFENSELRNLTTSQTVTAKADGSFLFIERGIYDIEN